MDNSVFSIVGATLACISSMACSGIGQHPRSQRDYLLILYLFLKSSGYRLYGEPVSPDSVEDKFIYYVLSRESINKFGILVHVESPRRSKLLRHTSTSFYLTRPKIHFHQNEIPHWTWVELGVGALCKD